MTAAVATPEVVARPAMPTNLEAFKRSALREMVQTHLGYSAPAWWSAAKCIEALRGQRAPRNSAAKAQLTESYKAKSGGIAPTASWSCKKLVAACTATVLPLPGGKNGKAAVVAAYKAKMGCEPTKGWSTAVVKANMDADKRPGQSSKSKGGLTAVACKALIAAALTAGTVTKEQVKGRSTMKADDLRSLVAALKLS
jgi:hypothetical protein